MDCEQVNEELVGCTDGATITRITRSTKKRNIHEANINDNDNHVYETKKRRMDQEQINEIKEALCTSVETKLDDKIEQLKTNLKKEIKNDVQNEIKTEIKDELKSELKQELSTAYNISLMSMIKETEMNLVILGLPVKSNREEQRQEILKVGEKMGLTDQQMEETKIRRWFYMGKKPENAKRHSVIVEFESSYHRNIWLNGGGNLEKKDGISIDIDPPLPYRAAHRDIKREASKQRIFFGMKTRIRFSGPEMQLRIRKNQDSAWTILRQFTPKPEQVKRVVMTDNAAEGGNAPSIATTDEIAAVKKIIRIGNYPIKMKDGVHQFVAAKLKSPYKNKLRNVSVKGKVIHLQCEDESTVQAIHNYFKSHKTEVDGKTIWTDHYHS